MVEQDKDKKIKIILQLNFLACFVLVGTLFFYLFKAPLFRNETILAVISVIATSIVIVGAIRSLIERRISIDLLAGIALTVSLLERQWVSAIFINLMIACAKTFTDYVKIRSHSAINSLLKSKPTKVRIKEGDKITEIPIEKVKIGDLVMVELGENIPVDGTVQEGEAEINQASLTGESIPILKAVGAQVLSFTTVVSGNLIIRVEKVGQDTTFEKIVALVEQSQENKAPVYTAISRFANWYVVLTLVGSLVVYIISRNITLVLSLLLVSCADDIAVATPLALMSAITHSAKHGAIVKGGDFLEALAKVKTMVFDKTGTLTRGKLRIERTVSLKTDKNEVLKLAAAVSLFSTHPIARTIIERAENQAVYIPHVESFQEYAGKGMTAVYHGELIVTGKPAFLQKMGIRITKHQTDQVIAEEAEGFNITLVGYANDIVGYIVMADELRPKAETTISELKNLGIKNTVMLTGDNEKIAEKTAGLLGIDEFHANLLPADKIICLKKYLNKKTKTAMVGDGVNDAPTLALADVGIAMGTIGSDAAIEAADIAIMKDDLAQIPELIKIGHATINVIRQNLIIWGILNVLGFSLVFLHILEPGGAAIFNFATDFIPIINSLRLFR